jgi:tetratricopeptide (TPR) repeat protein
MLDKGATGSASKLLRRALRLNPEHPDIIANHASCLGMSEDWQGCLSYSLKAIEKNITNPMARLWHARALAKTSGTKEAINYLKNALSVTGILQKQLLEQELIGLLVEAGRHREAIRLIINSCRSNAGIGGLGESALEIARTTNKKILLRNIIAHAHQNSQLKPEDEYMLAELELELGNESRAILHLLAVAQSAPSHAKAWRKLGLILKQQKNYKKAMACLSRSVKEDSGQIECWHELIETMKEANMLTDALIKAKEARSHFDKHPQCWLDEAFILIDMDRTEEAIDLLNQFKKRSRRSKENAEILNCEGLALLKQRRLEKASITFRSALKLSPSDSGLWNNLGMTYGIKGNHKAEILCYKNAIRHAPEDTGSHVNLAMAYLAQGEYDAGLKEYEWRIHAKQPLNLAITGRIVNNDESPPELIVCTEQGLGDTIQFCRFLVDLRLRHPNADLTLVCPAKLQKLLSHSCKSINRVLAIEETDLTTSNHIYLPLMSIPHHCGIKPKHSKSKAPYINIPEETSANTASLLRRGVPSDAPIIALTWKGNPDTEKSNLSGRSMELERLRLIADAIPNAFFVSLQKGSGSEELHECSFRERFVPSQHVVSEDWCFSNTAGYMLASDYIVTTDTCNAHLAGALGKESHLLLAKMCEWRWRQADGSPDWYPYTRQHRQKTEGIWEEAILDVAQAIKYKMRRKQQLDVPTGDD